MKVTVTRTIRSRSPGQEKTKVDPFKTLAGGPNSVPRINFTKMFRALKPLHIRRRNKRLRLIKVPITNRSAPYRSAIIGIIRLEDVLFISIICGDGTADVTNRDGECSFPAGTVGAGVGPLALEGGLDAVVGCDVVVAVAGYVVGV